MRHGRSTAVRLPDRMYGMLPPEGLRLPHAGRSEPDGGIHGHDLARVRKPICVPHETADAAAGPPRRWNLPVPARRGLFDPSGEADAAPDLSVLAGTGGEPARMEEDGAVLPRDR